MERNVGGHAGAHVEPRDVSLGVLREMEVAGLPRNGGEDGSTGGGEAARGIADDEGESVKASGLERGEEGTPVDLRFGEGNGGAEDGAFAVGEVDANSGEDGAGAHDTGGADFFVTGIDDEVGHGREGAMTPSLKEGIELRGGATDLRGGDFQAAEVFEDFGNAAGGYTLQIHLPSLRSALRTAFGRLSPCGRFSDGEGESLFAALTAFEGAGEESHLGDASLRNWEIQGAHAGIQTPILETIGVSRADEFALIRGCSEMLTSFDEHGVIDQQTQGVREAGETVFKDNVEDFGIKGNLALFGHGMCLVLFQTSSNHL